MKFFALAAVIAAISGCATPLQNAALVGAVTGAAVMSSYHQPVYAHPVTCSYVRGGFAGYDPYGRPMFRYHQACR